MAPAAPHTPGAGARHEADRSQHHHKQTSDHKGRAGSCWSVASHEMQGTGLPEGIRHLGELHKACGRLLVALKPFIGKMSSAPASRNQQAMLHGSGPAAGSVPAGSHVWKQCCLERAHWEGLEQSCSDGVRGSAPPCCALLQVLSIPLRRQEQEEDDADKETSQPLVGRRTAPQLVQGQDMRPVSHLHT